MVQDLSGKVALITGGTAGVGFEAARQLASRGADVVLTGRSVERAEAAASELAGVKGSVTWELGDASDPDSLVAIVEKVSSQYDGGIDMLVSAGATGESGPAPFADLSFDEIVQSFNTRFFPRIFPVRAAIPALKRRGGSVVMLTTDAARQVTTGESVVGAAGAGVILLTKALGREFARWNVRVNCVAMTLTSGTPSWNRIFEGEGFQNKIFEKALTRFPQGRPPSVEEVADVVSFLAADASQVTGQTVSVNGGLSFGGW
ncbi:SDR family oxidoreductase [Paenarthrobacter sp. NPDC089316]|uniref:SDR family NAD(P)-dependent oxidoreductase n=1 Tax=unclassified Paenarthrobacter TaxID=2634190 RepID=UPI0034239F0F